MRKLLLVILSLSPTLAPFVACGSDGSSAAEDAGADEGAVTDARNELSKIDSPLIDTKPDGAPTYNTDGWVGIPFDPDVDCGFYAAPSPAKMPAPIEWETCDPGLNAFGWACRQIVTNWAPPDDAGDTKVIGLSGMVENDKATLAFARFSASSIFQLVGDADGPTRQAVVYPRSGSCYLNDASIIGNKVIYSTSRQKTSAIYRWGAIGGDVDRVPLVLESYGDGVSRGYAAGPNAYVTFPAHALRTWASPSTLLANVSTPSPGEAAHYAFVGDAMFFNFGNLAFHRISLYTPDAGTRDFVSYGNDVSKGAADFGTDGKDMAWTEAAGRTSTQEPWAKIDIMTAPFTTDPSAVEKRRLRSEATSIGAAPFLLGCGYAAHEFSSATEGTGTRLVRLADGRSWRFTLVKADAGQSWVFTGPLAVTCDEIFVKFHRGVQFNVARIRLDSLGPGDPPD